MLGPVLFSASARSEWGFGATGGFAYDDNLSNGFEADDRKAATAAVIDVSGGWYAPGARVAG